MKSGNTLAGAVPATELLWISEPRRATALAKVTAVAGRRFALDRSLFAPTSKAHRHPQPGDRGTVWWDGSKRKLERSAWRDGTLWHEVRGAVPKVGTQLNCQLDVDRRLATSRAHSAMHLLLAALWQGQGAALRRDPEVKGVGRFRLDVGGALAPTRLAEALRQVKAWVDADHRIQRGHVARSAALHGIDAQRFDPPDPFPGPSTTLDVARIAGVCAYPCDGTHVERSGKVGRVVIEHARPASGGTMLVAKVA